MAPDTYIPRMSAEASAKLWGGGSSSAPVVLDNAGENAVAFWVRGRAATGDHRGIYFRLYLNKGAGGEAGRFYATVESNTPSDTVNGVHNSLSFGSSVGNITGLGNASRNTVEVPNRSLTGTGSAVMAELFAVGTSSALGGTWAFLRAVLSGNATGAAAIEDNAALIEVAGGTNASGNVVGALNGNEPTWTGKTALIRCKFNGQTVYLVGIQL